MHVLIVTVVHVPVDARIYHRQIRALLDAGHEVTYAAPWTAYGVIPSRDIRAYDLPRAHGRQRLTALRAARRLIRTLAVNVDLVLLHDPELLLALPWIGPHAPIVWDVHEDTAAAVVDKPWLPQALRAVTAAAVRQLERVAERHVHLLLAEQGYTSRFCLPHPVVPNAPRIPAAVAPSGTGRVVYVGRVARARGALELIQVAHQLHPDIDVDVIGQADRDVEDELRAAADSGVLRWHGFVPNDQALPMVEGATAGLSLVHDQPNHRVSLQTKVLEYLAWGVPVITTPLPWSAELVARAGAGLVVPFGDINATTAAILRLQHNDTLRQGCADAGRRVVMDHYDGARHGAAFVGTLEDWSRPG